MFSFCLLCFGFFANHIGNVQGDARSIKAMIRNKARVNPNVTPTLNSTLIRFLTLTPTDFSL